MNEIFSFLLNLTASFTIAIWMDKINDTKINSIYISNSLTMLHLLCLQSKMTGPLKWMSKTVILLSNVTFNADMKQVSNGREDLMLCNDASNLEQGRYEESCFENAYNSEKLQSLVISTPIFTPLCHSWISCKVSIALRENLNQNADDASCWSVQRSMLG